MKLLHTADWHLNDRLGKSDRTEALRSRVEKVARLCDEHRVDVLVHAGDLFSEQAEVSARVNEVAASFQHLRRTFANFFARGGIFLGVTGNHDQNGLIRLHIELARAGMDVVEAPKRRGDRFTPGRMYLLDTAFVGRVHDAVESFDLQFALLPYPSLGRVLTGSETASTPAELHRPVGESVAAWIRSLPELQGYDTNLRTVLVAHINVTGADVGRGLFRMAESADVIVDGLPSGFDYIALGHIHKPQCLRGVEHVRYSGSLDRMDFGELDEDKSVVIVDIGPEGRRSITPIQIEPTTLRIVTISESAAAAEQIAAQPAPEDAVVKVVVEPSAAAAGSAVDVAIRDAMLNISNVEWQSSEPVESPAALTMPVGSVRERVLDYVAQKSPDEHRESLLALAIQFLDREGLS